MVRQKNVSVCVLYVCEARVVAWKRRAGLTVQIRGTAIQDMI